MLDLKTAMQKSNTSKFWLWMLNFVLANKIPFNKPHHMRILNITERNIDVKAKYKRSNKNHLNGIHACLLATLCEYCTGLLLLSNFDVKKYRLILKTLKVDYLYQAKLDVIASYQLSEENVLSIQKQLEEKGITDTTCEIKILDDKQNHICTGYITWQIKEWGKVKTKL
jgi:acyl-coenzyme A thioesterase PaaI-like protein